MIESKIMRWEDHAAYIEEVGNLYRILVRKDIT
jgi:hypothetical protein